MVLWLVVVELRLELVVPGRDFFFCCCHITWSHMIGRDQNKTGSSRKMNDLYIYIYIILYYIIYLYRHGSTGTHKARGGSKTVETKNTLCRDYVPKEGCHVSWSKRRQTPVALATRTIGPVGTPARFPPRPAIAEYARHITSWVITASCVYRVCMECVRFT